MAKIVLDVPEGLNGLVESWRETLDFMKATLDRTGGGKAVDYAQIERETSEASRKSEREAHRGLLQAFDIDVPTVVIGGIRYHRVGRCEAPYHINRATGSVAANDRPLAALVA
jgi:glutaredoxin